MRMFKHAAILGLTVGLIVSCHQSIFGQTSKDELLSTNKSSLEIDNASLNAVLSAIAIAFKTPIGLELADSDVDEKPERITLSLRNVTLKEALEETFRYAKTYEWREVNGVINVYSTTKRDSVLRALLEVRINSYTLLRETSKLDIRNEIVQLPEVEAKLNALKLTALNVASRTSDFKEIGGETDMKFTDMSLQSVLNQIIRKTASKYWVIGRSGEENEFFTIRFL